MVEQLKRAKVQEKMSQFVPGVDLGYSSAAVYMACATDAHDWAVLPQ